MAKVSWRLHAKRDLRQIGRLIARERPRAALSLVGRIEALASLLADQPRMGRSRDDLGPSLRQLTEAPYIIVYRTVPDRDDEEIRLVDILRVIDGRRDLPRVFSRPRARR